MLPIRKILVPTDFSEHSRAAFDLACALARDYGAELLVLHVYRPPQVYAPDGIAVIVPEQPLDLQAQLALVRPADPQVKVDHLLVEGDPVEEILRVAGDRRCDLIVMGTHGTTGLARLLMGSVAESVVRRAPCPVLTIRNPVKLTGSA